MKKLLLILLCFPFIGFGQSNFKPKSKGQLVDHSYYSLSYDESHEQSEWVYYLLTSDMIKGNYQRTDNFRIDNKIQTDLNCYWLYSNLYSSLILEDKELLDQSNKKIDFCLIKSLKYSLK